MVDKSKEAVYLIRKHGAWYLPNSQGYTLSAIQAGRYTGNEAENITHPNGPDGPRDNMSFIHEDDLMNDPDWLAYKALTVERDAQAARIAEFSANINLKADFIEKTIKQLAASDQRIAELEAQVAELTKQGKVK